VALSWFLLLGRGTDGTDALCGELRSGEKPGFGTSGECAGDHECPFALANKFSTPPASRSNVFRGMSEALRAGFAGCESPGVIDSLPAE